MEVSGERVTGGAAAGDRDAHPKWAINTSDRDFENYESLFKSFVGKFIANQGSFKVDGTLMFEFIPKTDLRTERLISPETSFSFHRIEEGVVYTDNGERQEFFEESPAIENYHYQKRMPPLDVRVIEEFMPMI